MTNEELFRLQMELECIGLNSEGKLCRIPGPRPDEISSFSLVKFPSGYKTFVREDVPAATCKRLYALDPQEVFQTPELPRRFLECDVPFHGITGTMPATVRSSGDEQVVWDDEVSGFVVRECGCIISKAFSSRENAKAAELAVETVPEFRGRGIGMAVSIAWRNSQLEKGRVPFYSYSVSNTASKVLARKLEVVEAFEFLGYP